MPASRDYLPRNFAVFAVWLKNFTANLTGAMATKYGVVAATLTQLTADSAWTDYWAAERSNVRDQGEQVTSFVDAVLNGALGSPAQSNPTYGLTAPIAPVVPPGVIKRIRQTVAGIKAQKSIYTPADGEFLGIVTADEVNTPEEDYTPDVKLRQLANYGLDADFRLYGLAALRVEFRYKNGPWQLAAFLTSSPGVFNVTPQTVGEAEQIEIRFVFIKDNINYGNYSPIYTVVIAP